MIFFITLAPLCLANSVDITPDSREKGQLCRFLTVCFCSGNQTRSQKSCCFFLCKMAKQLKASHTLLDLAVIYKLFFSRTDALYFLQKDAILRA